MNHRDPHIPLIESPIGIDAVIQNLQLDLKDKLPWLEKSFGRAREFKEGNKHVPKVYAGSAEYFPVLPNDCIKAQSFFLCKGPETADFAGKQRSLSVIFWFNLREIYLHLEHIYTEELKREVEGVLSGSQFLKSIDNYYDERVEDVFDGYVSSRGNDYETDSKLLMYPYSGFRFDITVGYPADLCFDWSRVQNENY